MPGFWDGLDSPVGNPGVPPHLTQGSVPPHPTPNDLRVLIPKTVYVLGGREQVLVGPNSSTEWGLSRYFWNKRKDENVANQNGGVQLPGRMKIRHLCLSFWPSDYQNNGPQGTDSPRNSELGAGKG